MAVNTISHQDVKTNRHEYIGGSDIAKIMGLSRWGTPLSLWAEKTQKIPAKDLSDVEAVELGTDLEEFVAKKFTQKTGKAVRRSPKLYQHPDYPYMVAHVDRLVTGSDELLECKTCSAFKKDEWENDEIPQEYILQVMWYLGITGRRIGHIAVLIGGQSFKYKQIEFDSELFDTMVESAKEFWQHVQENTPPAVMANDDETLKDLYADHSEIMIELYPTDEETAQAAQTLEERIAYLQEVKAHIKSLQDEQKEIETHIKDIIKDSLGIKTPKYVVTWKSQNTTKFDTATFKEAHIDLYNQFALTSSFRVMRIKANKEFEVA
jgi:putative phage-type endonuclease